jgi:aarF domain-containing kinase
MKTSKFRDYCIPKLKRFAKFSAFTAIGLSVPPTLAMLYFDEENKTNPYQILKGLMRSVRLSKCGLQLLYIYEWPFSKLTSSEKHTKAGEAVLKAFEKNAGTYIKLGQALAMMDVLLPQEFCDSLQALFERAPRTEFYKVRKIIEEQYGKKLEDVFEYFDERPISSASIAQVHVARLKSTGEKVAVKVQHPWLRETVQFDISNVSFFIKLGSALFQEFHYKWIADDMKANLPQELDFRIEARNIREIDSLLDKSTRIRVPKPIEELSNERILVMEFIDGFSITDINRMNKEGIDIAEVAKILSNGFAKMIYDYGFVHADPHPGNIFLEKTKTGKFNVVLLDNGLYRRISPETKRDYATLWTGIITKKVDLIQRACESLGVGDQYKLFTAMVTRQTYEQVMESKEKDIKRRIKGSKTKSEQKQLNSQMAIIFREQILECLERMNRELILIFKINDYISSIDTKLGQPINNYYYVASYSMRAFIRSEPRGFWEKTLMYFTLYRTLFMLKMYELYLIISG